MMVTASTRKTTSCDRSPPQSKRGVTRKYCPSIAASAVVTSPARSPPYQAARRTAAG
ncbi:MAG: hypothetical protein IPN17_09990 [Deltaproteobacteria bacterium]|nr:hypothetical protein [Deltaproteobacteria bacterium]